MADTRQVTGSGRSGTGQTVGKTSDVETPRDTRRKNKIQNAILADLKADRLMTGHHFRSLLTRGLKRTYAFGVLETLNAVFEQGTSKDAPSDNRELARRAGHGLAQLVREARRDPKLYRLLCDYGQTRRSQTSGTGKSPKRSNSPTPGTKAKLSAFERYYARAGVTGRRSRNPESLASALELKPGGTTGTKPGRVGRTGTKPVPIKIHTPMDTPVLQPSPPKTTFVAPKRPGYSAADVILKLLAEDMSPHSDLVKRLCDGNLSEHATIRAQVVEERRQQFEQKNNVDTTKVTVSIDMTNAEPDATFLVLDRLTSSQLPLYTGGLKNGLPVYVRKPFHDKGEEILTFINNSALSNEKLRNRLNQYAGRQMQRVFGTMDPDRILADKRNLTRENLKKLSEFEWTLAWSAMNEKYPGKWKTIGNLFDRAIEATMWPGHLQEKQVYGSAGWQGKVEAPSPWRRTVNWFKGLFSRW